MDSKSVHRVAESCGLKRHYDAKLKLWTIGEGDKALRFTVDEVAKMNSGAMREKLHARFKPGHVISTSARQLIAEAQDGDTPTSKAEVSEQVSSDVAQAAELLKQTGGGVTAALQEHAENVAAGKAPPVSSKQRKTKGAAKGGVKKEKSVKREAGVVKIDGNPPTKPTREVEGKLWLRQFGIHKWALRTKAKVHEAPAEVVKLLKQSTQWYSAADMRQIVKHAVFTDQDKKLLANPEGHTDYAIKCAKSARDIAEKVLAAM